MNELGEPNIWPECETINRYAGGDFHMRSPRAGGEYIMPLASAIAMAGLDDDARMRLTTLLVDRRRMGEAFPTVTADMIAQAEESRPLPVGERALRLLRFIADRSPELGDEVQLFSDPDTLQTACAQSESGVREVTFLHSYLINEGLLLDAALGSARVSLTGYAAIEESVQQHDSQQAFVALWFGDPMKQPYDEAIEPAICGAGFEPFRIDRKPDVDKIDDEIIGEIRRSRFLIADFTPNAEGIPRGGVYFEAGFARGLGLPVISTCRKDAIEDLHFDTRQYYHIEWEAGELEAFKKALQQRILAMVGEGAGPTPATQ